MANEATLWMGSLEPYMDERFIWNAFNMMGHQLSGITIKTNKRFCIKENYGFVQFANGSIALTAMQQLNNQIIPGSNPPVNFILKPAMFLEDYAENQNLRLWIGRLSPDVDEQTLYTGFSRRFRSVREAKVILDKNGFSKGYGFVDFGNKEEQEFALIRMDGFIGIGSCAIQVRRVIDRSQNARMSPRAQRATTAQTNTIIAQTTNTLQTTNTAQTTTTTAGENYNNYFAQNWPNYAPWQVNQAAAASIRFQMPHASQHITQQQDVENQYFFQF